MATDLETIPVTADDELPDTALFWRWVGKATRPVVGWVLTGIGILLILIGYLGISREALVAKQLPYLISGGIGGIAVVGVGAVFLATEDIRRDSGRLDRLEAMVTELHGILLAGADTPTISLAQQEAAANGRAPTSGGSGDGNGGGGRVVAVPGGQTFHRPECSMVQGKTRARELTIATARSRNLNPCKLCEPAGVEA